MNRLEGKTAIVTGGTMGIGEAIVRRFADEGARMVVVARNAERGEALAATVGDQVRFLAGDITDPAVADAADAAAGERGGVDVLVNNAAVDFTSDLLQTDDDDVRRVFETNFFGSYYMLTRV